MKNLILLPVHSDEDRPFANLFNGVFRIKTESNLELINKDSVLLFGGGSDVSPKLYNARLSLMSSQPDYKRDDFETKAFQRAQKVGARCLGICRGSQFLCASSGGKLVQHISGHGEDHDVITKDGKIIRVTSTHHQMMYPFDIDHELLAISAPSRSLVYVFDDDNIVTRVQVEPEVVFFPKTNSLGIQGHPEYFPTSDFSKYCRDLVKEYLF